MNDLEASELENLSSTLTDLTLELAINADASSQCFSITSMTNPISATQTWAKSHFFRTTIIWSLLDTLGQKKNEDVSNYLRHGVINLLSEVMNAFN